MTSRLVMGVAVKILLILALSFCVEAQLSEALLVDVEAKDDVQVFWSIFTPMNVTVNHTYTQYIVYYGINLADPSSFNSDSPEAETVNAGNSNFTILPDNPVIPPGSDVTVVVVANSSTGVLLESSPPVTRRTFENVAGITAPEVMLPLERFDDNTILQVSWLAIDSPQILSYDIQYRLFKRGSPDFESTTTISSPGPSNLAFNITGLDGNTSYQVRVRGVVEVDVINDDDLINFANGPWSPWVASEVKPPPQGGVSGTTSVYAACNGIIFTTFLLAIIVFF